MEDKNILSGGIDDLYTIKERLLELNGYLERNKELYDEERRLESVIREREKLINEEADNTIKKRKEEVTKSFDEQINKVEARIKKVKAQKERYKDVKVSERVKLETKDLSEERVFLSEEIRKIFKIERICRIFNNGLFYAIYMPNKIKDLLMDVVVLAFVLAGIPLGIYGWFIPEKGQKAGWLILIYVLTIAVFACLYMLVRKVTKDRHKAAFAKIKDIRRKLVTNQKKTREVGKAIRRDKDESGYGLERFQDEIYDLERQKNEIAEELKKAIVMFESGTSRELTEAIYQNHSQELGGLKEEYERTYEEHKKTDVLARDFAVDITKKYEVYLGKELLALEAVDELIRIMESAEADTINGATKVYNDRKLARLADGIEQRRQVATAETDGGGSVGHGYQAVATTETDDGDDSDEYGYQATTMTGTDDSGDNTEYGHYN